MNKDNITKKTAEKRTRPDSSFELVGPTTPDLTDFNLNISTPKDLKTILDFSVESLESEEIDAMADMDEGTIARIMPLILLKIHPEMTQMANAAADKAVQKYREEIMKKDELIEMLRAEITDLQNLRSRSDGARVDDTNNMQVDERQINTSGTRNCASCTTNAYDIEALEQYSRRNAAEIRHVPEVEIDDKPTDDFVLKTARQIGARITQQDIGRSHKLGKAFNGQYSMIVKFVAHNAKEDFIKKRQGLKGNEHKTIICESLTKHRRGIMKVLDSLRYENKIFTNWSDDGKILFKHFKNSKTKSIPVRRIPLNGPYDKVGEIVEELKTKVLQQLRLEKLVPISRGQGVLRHGRGGAMQQGQRGGPPQPEPT